MSIHPLIIPMKQFTIISCFCALVHIKNKKNEKKNCMPDASVPFYVFILYLSSFPFLFVLTEFDFLFTY